MKKLFFFISFFIVLILTACGDSSNPIESVSENNDTEAKSSSFAKSSSSSEKISSSSVSLSSSSGLAKKTFTDPRDKQIYKTVVIGSQTWMAQNLNYATENSYCYNDNADNCSKYGRLYTWAAAMGACPSGWHLPTRSEFEMLFSSVGGQSTAGKMLKSTSGWKCGGDGLDAYSFSALPVGFIYNYGGGSYYEGDYIGFWSSNEIYIDGRFDHAYLMSLYYYYDNALLDYDRKTNALSVRCVKD